MATLGDRSLAGMRIATPGERPLPLRLLLGVANFARRKPLGFVGLMIVLALIIMAIFAPHLAPYSANKIDLKHALNGPSPRHRLGTNGLCRDRHRFRHGISGDSVLRKV